MGANKKVVFDRIMAEELSKLSSGPELEWFKRRASIERELDVPVDVFKTWFDYEIGRLEACKRFLKNWNLNTRVDSKRILDVGCGHGQMLVAIAHNRGIVCGVDPNKDRVKWAKLRLQLHRIDGIVEEGSAEQLPFNDKSMDAVFLLDVMEHVTSHLSTLLEIERVLRPNGLLIIGAPNRFSWRNIKKDPHYGLPLVCTFSPKLGKFLVVDLLRRVPNYTVGLFPTCSSSKKLLIRNGFNPIEGTHTWMEGTRGWTRFKRFLRCNILENGFVVIARKMALS